MAYVKRTIEMWFETKQLAFPSVEAQNAFYQALGQAIMYGTDYRHEDNNMIISINLENIRDEKGNIIGKKISEIHCHYKELMFTMGAVARDGGLRYTFHS